MRILFVMEHSGVGPLVPALRLLHARGHTIDLVSRRVKTGYSHLELQALAEECPGITYRKLPASRGSGLASLGRDLRFGLDYLRYLEPRYRDADKLRARAAERAPAVVQGLGRLARLWGGAHGVSGLRRALSLVERCLPPPPSVELFLATEAPDLVLITPLVDLGSRQADWLRAAKRRGIRTSYPVFSWDNLTNKGLVRDAPDQVLVWNDLQAREAEELHGVPPERVRITGAPVCDPWFTWQPSRSREEFCLEVGLRADRPIVLYLCSSRFVAPDELAFVGAWIERLRAQGGSLAEAGFLVRPYPDTARRWVGLELDGPQVRVWPRFGEAPHDDASRRNYFDSVYHSSAVVGINTTAQIESAIVGRPVHTLLAEQYRETQEGTLHFRYLNADEFGLLYVGRTFEEHATQLEASLQGRVEDGRNERFLSRFVRPLGLDRSATEAVVDAIEELGSRPSPAPDRGPRAAPVIRLALTPLAALAARGSDRGSEDGQTVTTAERELKRTIRRLRRDRDQAAVVAGPWLDDEIGEILYWIPFLRWVQMGSIGVRERLLVVSRASSVAWYEGVGAAWADVDEWSSTEPVEERAQRAFRLAPGAVRVLSPDLILAARADIAAQDPARRLQSRWLEFALLDPPEPPSDLELPDQFLAVRFEAGQAEIAGALAEHQPVVEVAGFDRPTQTAVLARANGFVGLYGVEAYIAALAGRPAVAFVSEQAGPNDLRVAASFLTRAPFGGLHPIAAPRSPVEAAEQALGLVGLSQALTRV